MVIVLDSIKERVQCKLNINLNNEIDEIISSPPLVSSNISCSQMIYEKYSFWDAVALFVNQQENHMVDIAKNG